MAKKNAHKLNDAQRAFVVQRVACFESPKEVAAAVREEYGIEISPQSIEAYDPTKRAGKDLAKRWRELFETTRKHFLDHVEEHIPEANKAVRVGHLVHAARAFKARGNYVGMADMLERIAKELGNVHTNRRELTGKDGKPIEVAYSELTDDQLNAKLVQFIQMAADQAEGAGDGRDRAVH